MRRTAWIWLLSGAVLGLSACAKDRGATISTPPAVGAAATPVAAGTDQTSGETPIDEPVDFAALSDEALGQRLYDPRAQAEISRRFRQTMPLRLTMSEGQLVLQGVDDFSRREELFLQLMNVFFLKHDQLTGARKDQVEAVFGPGTPDPAASSLTDRYIWDAGRGVFVVEYQNNHVMFAAFLSE